MQVHAILCWSFLFASFTAAYLIPKTTEVKNLDATVIETVPNPTRKPLRGSTGVTAYDTFRGSAISGALSPSRATGTDLLNDSVSESAAGQIIGTVFRIASQSKAQMRLLQPCDDEFDFSLHHIQRYGFEALDNASDYLQFTAPKNATSKANLNSNAEIHPCIFAVQDVVSIRYWAHTTTQTSATFDVTALVSKLNLGSTTVKRVAHFFGKSTVTTVFDAGRNIFTAHNNAAGPRQDIQFLNGSVVTTLGLTIYSPQPFFVYKSIHLIHRPPITRGDGNLACVTTSTVLYQDAFGFPCSIDIFSKINPYVSNYWSGRDQANTFRGGPTTVHTETTAIVKLETPFVYQPKWAISSGKEISDYGYEDYGYVPQALVDHVYTVIAPPSFQKVSVIPGGPLIEKNNSCIHGNYAYIIGQVVDRLTKSSEEINDVGGCFHPGTCPGANGPAAAPAQITSLRPAVKTHTANNQGATAAPARVSQGARATKDKTLAQISRQQSSPTDQPSGGTSGQQLPPRSNSSPLAPAQKLNGVWPDIQFRSQPNSNHGAKGQVTPSQTKPRPVTITTAHIASQIVNSFLAVLEDSSQAQNSIIAGDLPLALVPAAASVITVGGSTLNADSKESLDIKSQTLAPGSSAIIAFGSISSLLPSASAPVMNGITSALTAVQTLPILKDIISKQDYTHETEEEQNLESTYASAIKIGSQPVGINSLSHVIVQSALTVGGLVHTIPQLVIEGQTVSAGGDRSTASGAPMSLVPFGNEVIIGSSSEILPNGSGHVLTIGWQTITATEENDNVVRNQTLTPGAVATNVGTFNSSNSSSDLVIQGTLNNPFNARQTNQSSLEHFTGDGEKNLPGMKTIIGILFANFFTCIFFSHHLI